MACDWVVALDAIIVAGGFAVLGAGVALIWKKRPASSVWIIFAFGFLLVLIGSPIGRNLTNLSVDQKGLQVSFQSVRTSPSAERAKSAVTQAAIQGSVALPNAPQQSQLLIVSASRAASNELLEYVRWRGYLATGLTDTGSLPGSLWRLAPDGSIRLEAAASDAFPKLKTVSTVIDMGDGFAGIERDPSDFNRMARVSIRCTRGAVQVEAIPASLANTINPKIFTALDLNDRHDLAVVTSAILCRGLIISSSITLSGRNTPLFTNERDLGDVSLGMRLQALHLGR